MAKKPQSKKSKLPIATDIGMSVPAYKKPTKEDIERQRRYAAEDGLRAIQRAEEIKKDKKLMADVKALAQEQMTNLKKFC